MPATNATFKKLIFDILDQHKGQAIAIEIFYNTAEKRLKFDQQDLASTILRDQQTGEPSWKRNLRNSLQGLKNRGEVVNSAPSYWRMPTPDFATYIDPGSAWMVVKQQAIKAKDRNEVWSSPKNEQEYHVEGIENNKIFIKRHSSDTVEKLYENDVVHAFISLNAAGGTLGRRAMSNVVAKEACLVHFHPNLTWDDSSEFIQVRLSGTSNKLAVIKEIAEADNDDLTYQPYARRIRKGQPALRKNLLSLYGGRCCVSRTGPENVLQAAHIEPHVKKGNNHSSNALLMRSDIHDLFDDYLILIEPVSLKIFTHPSLRGTIYYELNGKELLPRSDGNSPDNEKLKERWQTYYWVKM